METGRREPVTRSAPAYEPPRVEQTLGPVELEREILYAGGQVQSVDTDGG